MKTTSKLQLGIVVFILCQAHSTVAVGADEFTSRWSEAAERVWVGPEYWANRLQDWRIAHGRLECVEGRPTKPMRTVHLLTRRLGANKGGFAMSVRTGLIDESVQTGPDAAVGFLIGAGGELDYRAAALVHHSPGPGGGIIAAMDGLGRPVFRDMTAEKYPVLAAAGTGLGSIPSQAELRLTGQPLGNVYTLTLSVCEPDTGEVLSEVALRNVSPDRLVGNVALVSHPSADSGAERFWFSDWTLSGKKFEAHDSRLCGPILCAQYTLSRGILKMTAQMMPLGKNDAQLVTLEVQQNGEWRTASTSKVIPSGYTAPFRVEDWDSSKDMPYRVVYNLKQADGSAKAYTWSGTIQREPVDKPTIVVAAFTGNHNVCSPGLDRAASFPWTKSGLWFPHSDIVDSVGKHRPDVLFFSGDQVYQGSSPTRPELTMLDYLYKWYLWCWAFRDLARDNPCICIPDDHDVYHGNVWGAGGRKADEGGERNARQDSGGYIMPADLVNMVQRTQTSHLPDPYDPRPVEQGIGVYYCAMNYGGISFAVIEDRKFKSSPTVMVPEGEFDNGWPQNPDFDPAKQADAPGAVLLGDRQLDFLRDWSGDWGHGAEMKAVLSQTIFSNVATLPRSATSDKVVSSFEPLPPDSYSEIDKFVADADSNGWPQTGRNKALREMRRGFAVHIAGDQHLGSTIQYGVDNWHDAAFALCVPSIANYFPRRWYPPVFGGNREPGSPRYTGDYYDGFGNRMTVHAVSNPVISGHEPAVLHDRAPGYGIARFNKTDRTIMLENWPRWADPSKSDAKPYPGWPVTCKQMDNYGRKAVAYLPTLKVSGLTDPVVQVIDEANGEVVYTLRIKGSSFRPRVFRKGTYTVNIGDPDTGHTKTLRGIKSLAPEEIQTLELKFES